MPDRGKSKGGSQSLLMREGANLLYLETDSTKSQEAMSVALALTSVVANQSLQNHVKHAILAAGV